MQTAAIVGMWGHRLGLRYVCIILQTLHSTVEYSTHQTMVVGESTAPVILECFQHIFG